AIYNNGDDDDVDYTIAITPVLSTEDPENSLSMGDEHLETIPATESDEVIKSSVEDLVPILTIKDNPTPSSKFLTKSSCTSPKSFLEETNTFDNSLLEFESFCFDLEEISSGSTTTHYDISLSEYDLFIFNLSNDQFPPTDRSDFTHEDFTDKLAHIISPPEYDCFYFRNFPDMGEIKTRKGQNRIKTGSVEKPRYKSIRLKHNSPFKPRWRNDPGKLFATPDLLIRDCSYSKGNVEDKILVPKPPKNYARCARCGHQVDGPYCQRCALLRKKLEEDLGTHSQDFQNTFESSDDSTNVVIAPREPFFPVIHPPPQETSIKILHDQENAINAVQTFLRKFNRYSFSKMPKVLLLAWDRVFRIKDALGNKQYKPKDIQEVFHKLLNDVQNIHEELAKYINTPGWNRPAFYKNDDDDDVDYTIAITPVLSTEEPDNSLSMGDEHLDTILATKSDEVIKSSVKDLVPSESEGIPDTMSDVHLVNNPTPIEAKDHFEIVIKSNDDYSSSDDNYLYNENIEYVKASPYDSELVSLEVENIVIQEDEEIEYDNLHEKLLKVNLLIAKIEALKDNPTPSSEFLTKSSSTSPKSFLEETNTIILYLNLKTSALIWKRLVVAVPLLILIYLFWIMKLSLSVTIILKRLVFPPTDRSDNTHEEFADELAHIISLPEYDCFYFRYLLDLVEDDHSPLLAYVVWIFLAYLTYPVIPPHLHSFGNEDTIFDPGITINYFYSFKSSLSHRCGTVKKF
nr:hypothetical protein [Tanacetum cinerariifolium]